MHRDVCIVLNTYISVCMYKTIYRYICYAYSHGTGIVDTSAETSTGLFSARRGSEQRHGTPESSADASQEGAGVQDS